MTLTSTTAADTAAARDPATDPEVLKGLAKEHPRLVAGNPGAPIGVLASLAHDHPDEVAGNPAIELGLLTGENILDRLFMYLWDGLLASRQAPEALLVLAGERLTRPEWFEARAVRSLLANPRTPRVTIEALDKLLGGRKNKNTRLIPVGEVRRHRNHPKPVVPRDAHQALEAHLSKLEIDTSRSGDRADKVLATTALPEWVQVRLAERNALLFARSRTTCDAALDILIPHDDRAARHALAGRRDLTPAQYWNLLDAHKYDQSLKLFLLRNEVLPPEVVARLVRLLGAGAGMAALTHKNMTVEQLDRLAADPPHWLSVGKINEARQWARAEPLVPQARQAPENRWGDAHSVTQVEQLKSDRHDDLLLLVALAPQLHAVVARALANVPHPLVRLALSLNPVTPEATLERLRQDGDLLVAAAASR